MTLKQKIYNKYNGKCAYSGTPLKDDWQIEHFLPKARGGTNDISNLLPVQKTINHYKRCLTLEEFREYRMMKLHVRLSKLPKKTKSEKAIQTRKYLTEVADYFGVNEETPFCGKFYFETI